LKIKELAKILMGSGTGEDFDRVRDSEDFDGVRESESFVHKPDYDGCIKISTDTSLSKMNLPGVIVLGSPLLACFLERGLRSEGR
jgi:Na+/H+-translocating membrane pyrophosphatase